MSIIELQITNFRNLHSVVLQDLSRVNLFYGLNGSGKTSLLEAIYYLGLGKSFRAHEVEHIIHHSEQNFSIYAGLLRNSSEINTTLSHLPVGIERSRDGGKRIRIDGESIVRISILAQQLPLKLLSTESHRFFYDGSKVRRPFLDWECSTWNIFSWLNGKRSSKY